MKDTLKITALIRMQFLVIFFFKLHNNDNNNVVVETSVYISKNICAVVMDPNP